MEKDLICIRHTRTDTINRPIRFMVLHRNYNKLVRDTSITIFCDTAKDSYTFPYIRFKKAYRSRLHITRDDFTVHYNSLQYMSYDDVGIELFPLLLKLNLSTRDFLKLFQQYIQKSFPYVNVSRRVEKQPLTMYYYYSI